MPGVPPLIRIRERLTPDFAKWLKVKGWSVAEFVWQAFDHGLKLRETTVRKWERGAQPRVMMADQLKKAFPDIRF